MTTGGRAALGALLALSAAGGAAAQVDPHQRWRTLDTQHFRVHVAADQLALGRRAAAEAEAAWTALASRLPAPRRRVDLVVADNADAANGYASTYPVPGIVVYALPPAGDLQLERYDRWLRLVITHELAHIFHLDLARGWWGLGRRVFGRAPFLFPNQYTPPWMREGLATYYESRLTDGGRLGSGFHEAAVRADRVSLSEASISSPIWPAGVRPYALGSSWFGYLAGRAGEDAVARFATASAGLLVPWVQLSGAARTAAGEGAGALWRDWQSGVARADGPTDTSAVMARGLRLAVPPRLSADGRQALLAWNDGTDASRLVVMDRTGGARREVARLNAVTAVAWLGSDAMVVSQLEYQDRTTLRGDLWRIGPDGREQRLTSGARVLTFDAAPDGRIVAVRAVPGGTELAEATLAADGVAWRTLVPAADGVDWADPRVAPDGRTVAAVMVRDGRHDVVLLDRDGRLVRRVTDDAAFDLAPAFLPDGSALVWAREVDGLSQLVVAPLSGADTGGARSSDACAGATARGCLPAGMRLLTAEPFAAYGAAPAGDTLVYLAYAADGWRLVARPLRPGAAVATPADAPADAPAPAPLHAVPAESLRARGYSPFPALLPQYWVPLITTGPGGAWLGALSSSADPVERYAWTARLQAGVGDFAGRWQGAFGWTMAGPGSSLLDAAWVRDESVYPGPSAARPTACCDRDESVGAGLSLVRRRWRTVAAVRLGAVYDDDAGRRRAGGVLSGTWTSALTPALAIGPQDGARVAASLRVRRRLGTALTAGDASLRVLAWRSLGRGALFARPVLAARAAAGATFGGDLVEFGVGGESGSGVAILPGVSVGGTARTFPVRGYGGAFIQGRRALSLSVEQRVPLALVGRNLGLMPVGLDRVWASVFADAGAAFSSAYCGAGSTGLCSRGIASAGAELSSIVALGYDLPVVVRGGLAVRLTYLSGPAAWVAVGAGF